ncbi:hypothetical protein [Tomitella gaofuii]|uniref:hypothetical protein n=1 Tax=Tomitella gaofuii TaxID=2760083 RepID=UPI0015F840AA|nr:hypothetical protein [Tomitella gaofuii]
METAYERGTATTRKRRAAAPDGAAKTRMKPGQATGGKFKITSASPSRAKKGRSGLRGEAQRIAAVLPADVIADAVGVSTRTVHAWVTGGTTPTGVRARRLAELSAVNERIGRVLNEDYIPVWLIKPNAALDEQTPVEAIAAGESREVLRLISSLESPGAA